MFLDYSKSEAPKLWLAAGLGALLWVGAACAADPSGPPVARLLPPPDAYPQAPRLQPDEPEPIKTPPAPQPPAPVQPVQQAALSLPAAIAWALENNPELRAFRQERGIA